MHKYKFLSLLLGIVILLLLTPSFFYFKNVYNQDTCEDQVLKLNQAISALGLEKNELIQDLENIKEQLEFDSVKFINESKKFYQHDIMDDKCNKEECLFYQGVEDEEYYGLASLGGYYINNQRTVSGETKNCDEFVVTTGTLKIIDSYKRLIGKQDYVNRLDDNGNLVIVINTDELSSASLKTLLSSSVNYSVSMKIIIPPAPRDKASVCDSNFYILSVNK